MKWFRFYSEALDDPKVQRLPGDLFKTWVNLMCLANKREPRGKLPNSLDDIAFALRVTDKEAALAMQELQERGLLDEVDGVVTPHNWAKRQPDSDDSADRKATYRSKSKEVGQETGHATGQSPQSPVLDSDTDSDTDINSSSLPVGPTEQPAQKKEFGEDSEPFKLSHLMRSEILKNLPEAKLPEATPKAMAPWSKEFDRMMRLDHREPEAIADMIRRVQADSFWQSNVMSPQKLRQKWDQLRLKLYGQHLPAPYAPRGSPVQGRPTPALDASTQPWAKYMPTGEDAPQPGTRAYTEALREAQAKYERELV